VWASVDEFRGHGLQIGHPGPPTGRATRPLSRQDREQV
jgi:hypothetical protein